MLHAVFVYVLFRFDDTIFDSNDNELVVLDVKLLRDQMDV